MAGKFLIGFGGLTRSQNDVLWSGAPHRKHLRLHFLFFDEKRRATTKRRAFPNLGKNARTPPSPRTVH